MADGFLSQNSKYVALGEKVNFSFKEEDFLKFFRGQLVNDIDFMINDMIDRIENLKATKEFESVSKDNNFFSGFEELGFNYYTKENMVKEDLLKRYNLKSFLFDFFLNGKVEFVVEYPSTDVKAQNRGIVRKPKPEDSKENILILNSQGQDYYSLLRPAYYMYYGLLSTLKRQAVDNKLVFKTSYFDGVGKLNKINELKSQLADALQNQNDALIMGKDDEVNLIYEFKAEFIEKGLTAVYNMVSKVLGEPISYFFGQAPKGENATGEFDFKNHLDNLRKNITIYLEPILKMFKNLGVLVNEKGKNEVNQIEMIEEQKFTMQDLISLGQEVVTYEEAGLITEIQKKELMEIVVNKAKQLMGVDIEN